MDAVTKPPFPYSLGKPAGFRANLGVIVLSTDLTVESDMRRILPGDGVALYTSRIRNAAEVTASTLAAMEELLEGSAALMPRDIAFDSVGYCCTSGTAVIGQQTIADRVRSGCRADSVTEPISALIAACGHLGIRRLAFLSPYVEEVSSRLRAVLAEAGVESPCFGSFNEGNDEKVALIDADSIRKAALSLWQEGGCDALFISCTNLQTLDVIPELEKECGSPILSSNLVLAWHMLRQAGLEPGSAAPNCRLLRQP